MFRTFAVAALLVGSFFFSGRTKEAIAGGFVIPHQTSRALALSNAVTAGVEDPSAVYYNPAALSEVSGNQFLTSGIYVHVASSVENSGRRAVNKHDDNYLATLFANYHIPGTDFTVGIGSYVPFGLGTTYETDFIRFAALRTELKPLYITPALSWHPSEQFSVGAGVSVVRASGLLSRALCFDSAPGGCGFEGKLRLTDTTNAFTYNLGILWKPTDRIKLGLSYRARTDLRFDTADVKFSALEPAKTKADVRPFTLPPVVNAGIFWQISPAWGLEFVYEFTRWSEFKHVKASFSPPIVQGPLVIEGFNLPQDWKNTSTLRLGTFYKLTENVELRTGIGFDETPIPSKTLSPAVPGADIVTFNAGVGYQRGKLNLDVGYMAVFYKARRVLNKELEGIPATGIPFLGAPGKDKYDTFNNFVGITLGYRF
jgi:long-chain fatty acid transport protein